MFIIRGWLTVLLTDVINPKKSMPYQLLPLIIIKISAGVRVNYSPTTTLLWY